MEDWIYEIKDNLIWFYQESEISEKDFFCDVNWLPYWEPRIDIVTDIEDTSLYLCWEFFFSTSSEHIALTYWTCYDIAFELAEIIHKEFKQLAEISIDACFTYQPEYENPVEQTT